LNNNDFDLKEDFIEILINLYKNALAQNIIEIIPEKPIFGEILKHTLIYEIKADHSDNYYRKKAIIEWQNKRV